MIFFLLLGFFNFNLCATSRIHGESSVKRFNMSQAEIPSPPYRWSGYVALHYCAFLKKLTYIFHAIVKWQYFRVDKPPLKDASISSLKASSAPVGPLVYMTCTLVCFFFLYRKNFTCRLNSRHYMYSDLSLLTLKLKERMILNIITVTKSQK